MSRIQSSFSIVAEKMRQNGLPDAVIRSFSNYFERVKSGETGLIPESSITSVTSLPDAEEFSSDAGLSTSGQAALKQTVVLKLNGGLGTGMGLGRAKSLISIKQGQSFLDIIAQQALAQGTRQLFMNSFSTRDDTLDALAGYPALASGIPLDFLQHKVPKITQSGLSPVSWPANPDFEWCPPGHGDIYIALVTSGMLKKLLDDGCRYVFVSNADNLGAVMDTSILGYFVSRNLPFLMEVTDRTEMDRKGGHLALTRDRQLILRESAQCPGDDRATFENISRHKYFNTNNLWLNLEALERMMKKSGNTPDLPMIRNSKTVDPRDPNSTPVYHLETAMGSAIGIFKGSAAVRVSRSRFAPVKNTSDLLAVRSDAYQLTSDYRVVLHPECKQAPLVKLDNNYFKLIDDMESRFPAGPPSLRNCESLQVSGDITFGRNVVIEGVVRLSSPPGVPLKIEDNSRINGS
jgi:UTP--glucose-1-phosphate uridylyltransferase